MLRTWPLCTQQHARYHTLILFSDKKTEVQRGPATCPIASRWQNQDPKPVLFSAKSHTLSTSAVCCLLHISAANLIPPKSGTICISRRVPKGIGPIPVSQTIFTGLLERCLLLGNKTGFTIMYYILAYKHYQAESKFAIQIYKVLSGVIYFFVCVISRAGFRKIKKKTIRHSKKVNKLCQAWL